MSLRNANNVKFLFSREQNQVAKQVCVRLVCRGSAACDRAAIIWAGRLITAVRFHSPRVLFRGRWDRPAFILRGIKFVDPAEREIPRKVRDQKSGRLCVVGKDWLLLGCRDRAERIG